MTHEHIIYAAITTRLLERHNITGIFDNAQKPVIAPEVSAQFAGAELGEVTASRAAAHCCQSGPQGLRQRGSPLSVALKQVQRHPLGRFWPDPRETAQRLD